MRALVVYESMFGNTEAVARAVADGIGASMDVELHEVSTAPAITGLVDLVVVGGPTHAFSLSRPSTRADAIDKGATHGGTNVGLREWIGHLRRAPHSEYVAAFDTRVDRVRRLPGSAARKAVKLLRNDGYTSVGSESFYVSDVSGPLLPGEIERAAAWGSRLGEDMRARSHGRPA
jgi:flavodoxin